MDFLLIDLYFYVFFNCYQIFPYFQKLHFYLIFEYINMKKGPYNGPFSCYVIVLKFIIKRNSYSSSFIHF